MNEPAIRPRRVTCVAGVGFAAFNGVVGMGIFALPGLVAGVLGPSAIDAHLGCLLIAGLVGLYMRARGIVQSGRPFIVPEGPVIPLLASALIVWLLFNALSWAALIAMTLLILAAGVSYTFRHSTRRFLPA